MDDKVELLVGAGGSIPSKWSQWNAESTYTPLRSVTHLGSSYVCKKACKGVDPEADVALGDGVEGEYWIKTASKGDKGDKGDRGIKGDSTEVKATEIEEGIQLDIKNTVYKEDGSAEEDTYSVKVKDGEKGDKGDPFTYEDLTDEQIKELQLGLGEAATNKDIIPEQYLTFKYNILFVTGAEDGLIAGDTYIIDWKGVRYEAICYDSGANDENYIGNYQLIDPSAEGSNYPFCILAEQDSSSYTVTKETSTAETVKIRVQHKGVLLAASGGGVSLPAGAKVGEIIQVSKVDASGKPTEWKASNPIAVSAELDEEHIAHFKNSLGVVLFSVDLSGLGVPLEYGDLVLSAESLTIAEGGSGTFTVKLASAPSVKQTVYLAMSDSTRLSVSPASLVFTPDNWATEQTVTLTALQDEDMDDDNITVTLTSKNVDGKSLVVTLSDDDKPTLVTDGLILHYDYTNKVDDTSDTIIDLANGVPATGWSSFPKNVNGVYGDGNSAWLAVDATSEGFAAYAAQLSAAANTTGFSIETFGTHFAKQLFWEKNDTAQVNYSFFGITSYSDVFCGYALCPYLNTNGESVLAKVSGNTAVLEGGTVVGKDTILSDVNHWVYNFNPDGTVDLYVNGYKLIHETNDITNFASWDTATMTASLSLLSKRRLLSEDTSYISCSRMYNRPLTTDEIEQNRGYLNSKLGLTTF